MTQPVSVVDRFVAGLRNNRLTGALIIVGIVVIALASFTEALTKIVALLPEFRETNIAGRWQSDVLTDAGTKFKYTYSFDLKTDGARLYGSVTRVTPSCNKSKAGACSGFGDPVAINEGKIERDRISFIVDFGEIPGSVPWTFVRSKKTFRGVVDSSTGHFTVQDDQNSPSVDFNAAHVSNVAIDTRSSQ